MLKVGLGVNTGAGSTGEPPAPPPKYTPSDFAVTHGIQDFFAEFYGELTVVIEDQGDLTFSPGGTFNPAATITAYHDYGSGDEAVFYIEDVSFTIDSTQLNASHDGITTTLFLSTDTFTVTDDVVMVKEAIPEGDIKYVIEFFLASPTPDGIYLNSIDASVTLETIVLAPDISEAAVLVYDLGDVTITESPSPNTVTLDLQLNFQPDPQPYTAPVDPQPLVFNIPSKLTAKQEIEGTLVTIFEKENTSITFTETEVPPNGGVINGQIIYDVDSLLQDIPIQAGAITYTFEITPTDIGYDPYTEGVFSVDVSIDETLLVQPFTYTFTMEEYSSSYLGGTEVGDIIQLQVLATFDADTTEAPVNPMGLSLNVVGTQTIDGQEVTVFDISNLDFYHSYAFSVELNKYVYTSNIILPGDLGEDGCLATIQSQVPLNLSISIPEGTTSGNFTIAAADTLNFTIQDPFPTYSCEVIGDQPLLADGYYSMSVKPLFFDTGYSFDGPVLNFSIFYGFVGTRGYLADNFSSFIDSDLVSKTFTLEVSVANQATNRSLLSPQDYIVNSSSTYIGDNDYLSYQVDFSVDLTTASYTTDLNHNPELYGYLRLRFKIDSSGTITSEDGTLTATSNVFYVNNANTIFNSHGSAILKYPLYDYEINFTA